MPATAEPPPQGPERRLQYLVLADLVASTATTREMGNDVGIYRMREFKDAVEQALNLMKPRPSARIVKTIGDAVLLTFDHFPHILCWKLEFDGSLQFNIQADGAHQLRAQGMPPMQARIWIHVGEVEYAKGDIYGLAVNELCKIEQAAKPLVPPGAVVATKAVREVAGPTLFPKQCKFTTLQGSGLRGGPPRLFTIDMKADIAFMITQQRKAEQAAAQNPDPVLDIQFAHIKRPTAVGGSPVTKEAGTEVRCSIRQAHQVTGEDLASLCPPPHQHGFTREAEYWTGFARFFHVGLGFAPIGLALRNTGRVTATDIRVELALDPGSKLTILTEDKVSMRPLRSRKFPHGGMFASHIRFGSRDLELQEEAGLQKVLWRIPKALPHLVVFSEEMFYVTASESGSFPLHCTIFAENLPQPARTTLTIHIETEAKDITIEEIAAFSEACTADDIKSGRGRLPV